jgi:hypothetical protein
MPRSMVGLLTTVGTIMLALAGIVPSDRSWVFTVGGVAMVLAWLCRIIKKRC